MLRQLQPLLGGLLGLAGTIGIVTGLLLLMVPKRHKAGQPQPLAWLQTDLDQPLFIEKHIYRHHRKAGAALMATAALWMATLFSLNAHNNLSLAGWLLSLSVLVMGLFMYIRPSALKPFENFANRWITSFRRTPRKNRSDGCLLSRPLVHPRITGMALLIGGLVCLWGSVQIARL